MIHSHTRRERIHRMQGCIQDFARGGQTWSMSKRGGGGEAVRSCRAAAGGWVQERGARITQGGANSPPPPPKYIPAECNWNAQYGIRIQGLECN